MTSHKIRRTSLTLSAVCEHSRDGARSLTERRARQLVTRPSGALVDEAAVRDWLAAMDAGAPRRAAVRRLSIER